MDGVDEADLAFVESENHGRGANAIAEETNPLEKVAIGYAGTGEDNFFAGSEVFGVVDAFGIVDAHFFEAFLVFRLGDDEAGKNLAVEAAEGSGGEDTFGSAARAHDHVNAGTDDGGGDSGGEVAVADQANTRAGFADVVDELFVRGRSRTMTTRSSTSRSRRLATERRLSATGASSSTAPLQAGPTMIFSI